MFAQRLKQLRKEKRVTQKQIADYLGLTQQGVAKWESGASLPETSILLRLAGLLGVSVDSLLSVGAWEPPQVRIVGAVRAGYNALALEEDLGSMPADVTDADQYRYLVVEGDSMEPYIRAGDLALVHLQPTLENGELGVVLYGDGEATLKRFSRHGGSIMLEPFNRNYETVVLTGEQLEDFRIFGKVVETKTRWD